MDTKTKESIDEVTQALWDEATEQVRTTGKDIVPSREAIFLRYGYLVTQYLIEPYRPQRDSGSIDEQYLKNDPHEIYKKLFC